jgi:hypothetical protein
MQLRRRLVGLPAIAAIALCASLVFAAPASAKAVDYEAPIPRSDGNGWITFKVKSKKNQRTKKFEPVGVKKLEVLGVLAECTDGESSSYSWPYHDLYPVTNRKFSTTDTSGGIKLEFKGRIPRNGPPKGTLRVSFTSPIVENGVEVGTAQCDSGIKAWTAKRIPEGTY